MVGGCSGDLTGRGVEGKPVRQLGEIVASCERCDFRGVERALPHTQLVNGPVPIRQVGGIVRLTSVFRPDGANLVVGRERERTLVSNVKFTVDVEFKVLGTGDGGVVDHGHVVPLPLGHVGPPHHRTRVLSVSTFLEGAAGVSITGLLFGQHREARPILVTVVLGNRSFNPKHVAVPTASLGVKDDPTLIQV